jgi:hypothetical protein
MTLFFLEISQDRRQWCHVSYLTRTTPTQAERRYDRIDRVPGQSNVACQLIFVLLTNPSGR